jgi:DNA-binding transcriptional regulator YdaS (Cro superfamily)
MTLSEYFEETQTTQAELARALQVSPGRLNHWVVGRHAIPLEMVRPIERETRGMVTREDILPEIYAA